MQLQHQRLSHDALYNLQEMAIDLPKFVQIWFVFSGNGLYLTNWRVLGVPSPQLPSYMYDTTAG